MVSAADASSIWISFRIAQLAIFSAEEIHDGRQMQPRLRGRDVGDIGEPDPVPSWRREVARDQVRCNRP